VATARTICWVDGLPADRVVWGSAVVPANDPSTYPDHVTGLMSSGSFVVADTEYDVYGSTDPGAEAGTFVSGDLR
jgi:hypothetical protein